MPTKVWPFGYGGAGANHPEYGRRLVIPTQIKKIYGCIPLWLHFIEAGVDIVPIHWVNKRLEE